ncbi:MAG: Hsp20/alpha crystallin family protein [Faecalibacterium sp.]|nr:Hsp20/alpha crystallin family protein [Faecalibacterium sp.]
MAMFDMMPFARRGAVTNYNPFRDFENMERQFFGTNNLAEFKTDILDQGDHYELRADLPGFKKEDINLSLDDNTLTINAERHSEWEDKDKQGSFVRCERSYGSYSRSYDMTEVQTENIEAAYDNGVLTLKLPKKAESVPAARRIEIR